MLRKLRVFIAILSCHPLAWAGSLATTFGAVFSFLFTFFDLIEHSKNQYAGLLFVMVVPPLFFGGLLLIPLGVYLRIRRERKVHPTFGIKDLGVFAERMDSQGTFRPTVLLFSALTCANILLTILILMTGYDYMESNRFCGTTCHTVMEPEYTVYHRSAHARVKCVECHIGSGVEWFIKAKINGMRQLVGITTGHYSKPIATPIHNLRPARETCEHCHWTDRFHGEQIKVRVHFDTDRENTKLYSVLLMKVGGVDPVSGAVSGVHWHTSPQNRVYFVSDKDERKKIPWVRYETPGRPPVEYRFAATDWTDEQVEKAEKRLMDCVDCHNRTGHHYRLPDEALDELLSRTPELQNVPFFKKESIETIQASFTEAQIEAREVEKALLKRYESKRATGEAIDMSQIAPAAKAIQQLYRENVWPRMNIGWGMYTDHSTHIEFPGCFRCHENTHRTSDGRSINADCRLCHTILALREPNPEILKQLKWTTGPKR